jgi:hypothetical protein
MVSLFPDLVKFAAATESGEKTAIQVASKNLSADDIRELGRLLHLFFGFPKVLRAFSFLTLGESKEPPPPLSRQPQQPGVDFFHKIYGNKAPRVLEHLENKDPFLHAWIMDHAYGRVLCRDYFSLQIRLRLMLLCLAKLDCWDQWESHARNALAFPIGVEKVIGDLGMGHWLDEQQQHHASQRLRELAKE